tara:strand:- start:220 stop:378 length:159 start_codon:yes stop_codon:yes gene_type:complete
LIGKEEKYNFKASYISMLGILIAIATIFIPLIVVLTDKPFNKEVLNSHHVQI